MVDVKLLIFELIKLGIFLYGVKIVYVNEDVEVFKIDEVFVIMGSFMMVNGELMVIVICWYVLRNGYVYILIDNVVVRFG